MALLYLERGGLFPRPPPEGPPVLLGPLKGAGLLIIYLLIPEKE